MLRIPTLQACALQDPVAALQLSAAALEARDEMMIAGEHAHVRLLVEDILLVARISGTTEDAHHHAVRDTIRTQGRRGFEIGHRCRLGTRHLHAAAACDLLHALVDMMTIALALKGRP